jgi:hypothetical protein
MSSKLLRPPKSTQEVNSRGQLTKSTQGPHRSCLISALSDFSRGRPQPATYWSLVLVFFLTCVRVCCLASASLGFLFEALGAHMPPMPADAAWHAAIVG